ncbi:MAG: hypothetical protein UT02_C0013G0007 [Parcubacteria group bacterium GW2011_GWC2_38_7]|nr:MAG: hypothetical protein UT02_C0013G0007 [Parcubacteria group bacterium GW2011_GWC2_38_7]
MVSWFKSNVAPAEAPQTAPAETSLDDKLTNHGPAKLEVVEDEPEIEAEPKLTMNDSQFWLLAGEKATQDAVKRFESTNKYFRALKAEGKLTSAKWDKESARYKSWMEATGQVTCAERLKTECASLAPLYAELAALPEVTGPTMFEIVNAINKKKDVEGRIIIQKNIIEGLQISFAEHQLDMEMYDAQIIEDDANAEEATKRKAEREAGLAEAVAARDELDAAEQAVAEKKKNFLGGFLMKIGLGNKEQKDAAKRLKTSKLTSAQMYDKHYEGTYTGPSGSGRATYRDRRDQMTSDMERVGRLFQ